MMGDVDNGRIITLDVGGTSVKSGVVSDDGRMLTNLTTTPINSQGTGAEIVDTLAGIIQSYLDQIGNLPLLGVGIGFPGPFDYEQGISHIQGVAKYEAIYGLNIGKALRQRLGLPDLSIRFRNDAEAAIVGEVVYGVGRPFSRIIGLTLGTGCGSAFLVNGRAVSEGVGVPPNGWLYPILFNGQQADEWFSIRGLLTALRQAGIEVADVKTAVQLAEEGDTAVQQVFIEFGQNLGAFLRPWVEDFQADVVLLQGGIANALPLFEQSLSAALSVPVLQGKLGATAALLGAARQFS
ncbi:ROK family protein [Candidatus Leptofilum sp.]|uniref:ROK family protein n=1 Tax=Candidatus Leptofilum sp. TaxID=3241576 RepID=UPI003B5A11E7